MAKEQLHMAVRMEDTMGKASFNISCEIASWPMLLALSLLIVVWMFSSVVGLNVNSAKP